MISVVLVCKLPCVNQKGGRVGDKETGLLECGMCCFWGAFWLGALLFASTGQPE